MTTATNIKIFENDGLVVATATAGQTVFPFDFPIFDETHITVKKKLAGGSSETTLTLATDYTVSGVREEAGGSVTLVSPAAAGDVIAIVLDVPVKRTTDFQTTGDFRAETINEELDLLVQMMQRIATLISRSITLPDTSPEGATITLPAGATSCQLGIDASGNVVCQPASGGVTLAGLGVPYARNIFIQPDKPTSGVADKDIWINTSTGAVFLYYQDADTLQWFEIGSAANIASVANIDDVDTTGAAEGALLVYDDSASKYVAEVGRYEDITGTTHTLDLEDARKILNCTNAGGCTITIPTNAAVALPLYTEIVVRSDTTGTVTIAAASGVTLEAAGGLTDIGEQYGMALLVKVGANTWALDGNLA